MRRKVKSKLNKNLFNKKQLKVKQPKIRILDLSRLRKAKILRLVNRETKGN